MKWIYDETLARERLENYEKEVSEENAWRASENKRTSFLQHLWNIGIVAVTVFLIVVVLIVLEDIEAKMLAVVPVLGVATFFIFCVYFYFKDEYWDYLDEKTRAGWKPLLPDVKYLLATDGKAVLSRDCWKDANQMVVSVTLENKEHFVSEMNVCRLTRKISTAVSEDVVDLTNGVYLVPYKRSVDCES